MIGRSDAELIIESLDEPARFGEIFDRNAEAVFRYLARRIGGSGAVIGVLTALAGAPAAATLLTGCRAFDGALPVCQSIIGR